MAVFPNITGSHTHGSERKTSEEIVPRTVNVGEGTHR